MSHDAGFERRAADLRARLHTLPDKPAETPEATLRALWHLAAGIPRTIESAVDLPLPALSAEGETTLDRLVADRIAGVPLAHLTGLQRFMGLDMLAGGEALIPRQETEILGAAALDLLRHARDDPRPAMAIDLCTGSGNLALALAHHAPGAQVFGSDISHAAIQLATRNAQHLHLDTRVEFRVGELFDAFDEPRFHHQVDLIVCNPPYISTAKVARMPGEISAHEPRLAFDGGALGISVLNRVIRDALRFLRPGGWLAIEVGDGQAPSTMRRMRATYDTVTGVADARGSVRAIVARTQAA